MYNIIMKNIHDMSFHTLHPLTDEFAMQTSETLIYLTSPKILLLNLLLRSILNGGSECSANNFPTYLHTYSFQSSMNLFLKSPEYLVNALSLLLILLAMAGG